MIILKSLNLVLWIQYTYLKLHVIIKGYTFRNSNSVAFNITYLLNGIKLKRKKICSLLEWLWRPGIRLNIFYCVNTVWMARSSRELNKNSKSSNHLLKKKYRDSHIPSIWKKNDFQSQHGSFGFPAIWHGALPSGMCIKYDTLYKVVRRPGKSVEYKFLCV